MLLQIETNEKTTILINGVEIECIFENCLTDLINITIKRDEINKLNAVYSAIDKISIKDFHVFNKKNKVWT